MDDGMPTLETNEAAEDSNGEAHALRDDVLIDVRLERTGNERFGLVLASPREALPASSANVVVALREGTPAALSGEIFVGDQILAVQGVACGADKRAAVLLRELPNVPACTFTIRRTAATTEGRRGAGWPLVIDTGGGRGGTATGSSLRLGRRALGPPATGQDEEGFSIEDEEATWDDVELERRHELRLALDEEEEAVVEEKGVGGSRRSADGRGAQHAEVPSTRREHSRAVRAMGAEQRAAFCLVPGHPNPNPNPDPNPGARDGRRAEGGPSPRARPTRRARAPIHLGGRSEAVVEGGGGRSCGGELTGWRARRALTPRRCLERPRDGTRQGDVVPPRSLATLKPAEQRADAQGGG